MTDNKIGVEGAKSVCEMLKTNITLTSLNLSGEKEEKMRNRKKEMMNE